MRALGVLWLFASACGSVKGMDVDAAQSDSPAGDAPVATHYHYVIDGYNVPITNQEAMQYGLDLDGDGDVDNKIGNVVVTLSTSITNPVSATKAAVDKGTAIFLVDYATTDFTAATDSSVAFFNGLQPSPPPCVNAADTVCRGHLAGTGTFTASSAPVNPPLVGDVENGRFLGGPGQVETMVVLPAGGIVRLHLYGAQVRITTADETRATLIIAGGVSESDRDTRIYPALRTEATAQIALSCNTAATPPACGCTPANSSGAAWLSLFDGRDGTAPNCSISPAEITMGAAASGLFNSDIMINGMPALSFGYGATAVKATFTNP